MDANRVYNGQAMMPDTLNAELIREPFVPLRLFLSDGQTVMVHNPGLCWIERGSMYLARTDRPNSRIMDDVDLISLRHIVRIAKVNGESQNAA